MPRLIDNLTRSAIDGYHDGPLSLEKRYLMHLELLKAQGSRLDRLSNYMASEEGRRFLQTTGSVLIALTTLGLVHEYIIPQHRLNGNVCSTNWQGEVSQMYDIKDFLRIESDLEALRSAYGIGSEYYKADYYFVGVWIPRAYQDYLQSGDPNRTESVVLSNYSGLEMIPILSDGSPGLKKGLISEKRVTDLKGSGNFGETLDYYTGLKNKFAFEVVWIPDNKGNKEYDTNCGILYGPPIETRAFVGNANYGLMPLDMVVSIE